MQQRVLLAALASSALSLTGFASAQNSTSPCADVHIIVVRASLEAPGQGIIGTLASRILAAQPGSTVEAIDYPALLTPYDSSSSNGTARTTKQLTSYVDRCGSSKIVLLGYSQGAHIVGDVVCGGGGGFLGPRTPPVDGKYSDRVVAMIQMGDPRHVANKTFDYGTSIKNGLFARPAEISCDPYASKIRSYCDEGDPYCDLGNNATAHRIYTFKYNDNAFEFVQSKLRASNGTTTSPSGAMPTQTTQPNSASALFQGSLVAWVPSLVLVSVMVSALPQLL